MARTPAGPEVQAFIRLIRVHERLQGEVAALLRSRGLSPPQYNVLRILRGAGDSALNCHEISERMVTRVPDITRLLDRLEQKGLVERRRSPDDRRVVEVRLGVAGRELLAPLDAPLRRLHVAQFAALTPDELKRLDDLLGRLDQP